MAKARRVKASILDKVHKAPPLVEIRTLVFDAGYPICPTRTQRPLPKAAPSKSPSKPYPFQSTPFVEVEKFPFPKKPGPNARVPTNSPASKTRSVQRFHRLFV